MSALEMPLAIPQTLWVAGLAFFVAVALLLLARALPAYVSGDLDALFQTIGSKSAVAEAKEEIIAVERAIDSGAKNDGRRSPSSCCWSCSAARSRSRPAWGWWG